MARNTLLGAALTASMVFVVSPIASATDTQATPVQQVSDVYQAPAQSANMLPLAMCGEREQMVSDLQQHFNEAPMAVGQVDGNAVVEILVSEAGSWTILATGTDGQSCIVSAGEGFESTTLVRGFDV